MSGERKTISMDVNEATEMVMSRVRTLEPENTSRIMGFILIQEQGEKEMIRLAFGPDTLLLSYINQAKAYLGLTSNNPSSKPSTPLSNSIRPNNLFPQTSPRILIPDNGFHSSNPSSPAAAVVFPRSSPRPISYAAVLNGSDTSINNSSNNGSASSSLQFYRGNDFGSEFLAGGPSTQHQLQDHLSYMDDSMADPIMSPSGRSDSMIFPYGEDGNSFPSSHPHPFHRRSCSVNDAAFEEGGGSSGGGFGWRPCMYFARGFCKNGSSCKFLHSDIGEGETIDVGSPGSSVSRFDEFLRMKALQHQRLALMASGGHHPFPHSNAFLRLTDDELMTGNQFHGFNMCGPSRNDFSPLGLAGGVSSSSRQLYLTFPAESTFKEEDVSSYFSMFGPVQDVRIPYQQKRMYGFVSFLYPETVKAILAKGNPHYVCDSRVLVKPYKEKGKVADKKQLQQQLQQLEMGDNSASLSPSGIDSREIYDLPVGPRILYNSQEMMLRRKFKQEAELQHAIQLQSRRMANLQLMDLNNQHHNHRFVLNLPAGVPISSPRQLQMLLSQNNIASSDPTNQNVLQELDDGQEAFKSQGVAADDESLVLEGTELSNNNILSGNNHQHVNNDDSYLPESLEHNLPDNLFSSPTKLAAEHQSVFSHASVEADNNIPITDTSSNNFSGQPSSSPFSMGSLHYSRKTRSH